MHVSANYSRALVLLSGLLGFVVVWFAGIRNVWLFVLFLPVGFAILTVVVRIAPLVVRPELDVGEPSAFARLDLK